MNVHHGGGEVERNGEVIQTLDNVALEAAGIGHDLGHGVHRGPFQRHAAGHDKADVAAAQNDYIAAGQEALHIHKTLGGSGGVDARRTIAGNVQRAAGPLAAAHGQNNGLCANLAEAAFAAGNGEHLIGG